MQDWFRTFAPKDLVESLQASPEESAPIYGLAGRWWCVDHPEHSLQASEWAERQAQHGQRCSWEIAFHGTNGEAYEQILGGGTTPRLSTGPISTSQKKGVYCEGTTRRACAHGYCVYFGNVTQALHRHPESMFAIIMEMLVDRECGTKEQASTFQR